MATNVRITKSNTGGFPSRLKQLRLQKGLSQKGLADILGLHTIHYGRYERGDSKPAAETLSKLADALGVSVDYLLEGDTENATFANLEDKELLKMFAETEKLDPDEKEVIKKVLHALLNESKLKKQYAS
jgi:transcriptional regulator with XRE-family HTH domain